MASTDDAWLQGCRICATCTECIEQCKLYRLRCIEAKHMSAAQRSTMMRDSIEIDHHINERALHEAVSDGCGICARVKQAEPDLRDKWNNETRLICQLSMHCHGQTGYHPQPQDSLLLMTFSLKNATNLTLEITSLELVAVDHRENALAIPGYRRTNRLDDESSMALVRHWTAKCEQEHNCLDRKGDEALARKWRPHRLLYIYQDLKLVQGDSVPEGVAYATLSHCWGFVESRETLVSVNETQWKQHLPEKALMPTFIDAVKIARQLGFHYIWIDSLCIVQDSIRDWETQAPMMAEIYKYSRMNIAATHATSDAEGFLHERDASSIPTRVRIEGSPPVDEYDRCITCGSYDVSYRGHFEFETQRMWRQPLFSCGWIFQERSLAPRTLHFSDIQLFWECDGMRASEAQPFGIPHDRISFHDYRMWADFSLSPLKGYSVNTFRQRNGFKPEVEDEDDLAEHWWTYFHGMWAAIVQAYSGTRVTYQKDKAVALAALAKELRRLIRSRFVAGLWEYRLVWQLSWTVADPSSAQRCATYCGPSWSWLSINGHVVPPVLDVVYYFVALAFVVDIRIKTVNDIEGGQVLNAALSLRGHVHRLLWRKDGKNSKPEVFTREMKTISRISSWHFDVEAEHGDYSDNRFREADFLVIGIQWFIIGYHACLLMIRQKPGSENYERVGHAKFMYHFPMWYEGSFGDDSFSASLGSISFDDGEHIVPQEHGMVNLTLV